MNPTIESAAHPQPINLEQFAPCPFCGRAPKVSDRASDIASTGWVYFASCSCETYSARAHQMGDTADALLERWNTRPGEVEALRGVLQVEQQCSDLRERVAVLESACKAAQELFEKARKGKEV